MLIKLLPEQISRYWDLIGHAIEVAAPPTVHCSPGRMNNILQALLEDRMQCWLICKPQEEKQPIILGVVVTTVTEDYCSGTKNLLIYALYSYDGGIMPKKIWQDDVGALKKFGKSLGCHRITAYTNVPQIVSIVRNVLGGEAEQTLITIPI